MGWISHKQITQYFTKIGWPTSILLFNQTKRDCSFSIKYRSLTCNSFIRVEGRGATFLCLLRRTPFIGSQYTFLFGSDWYQRKVLQCKFTEGVVQRFLRIWCSTFSKRLIFSTSYRFLIRNIHCFYFWNVWMYKWTTEFWYGFLIWCAVDIVTCCFMLCMHW